jgi:hypothetical protein
MMPSLKLSAAVFAATLANLANMFHAYERHSQQPPAPHSPTIQLPMIIDAIGAFHLYAQRRALALVQAAEADTPARRAPPPLSEADCLRVQVGRSCMHASSPLLAKTGCGMPGETMHC